MKWEPKRKRAAEDGGVPGWGEETLRGLGTVGAAEVAARGLIRKSLVKGVTQPLVKRAGGRVAWRLFGRGLLHGQGSAYAGAGKSFPGSALSIAAAGAAAFQGANTLVDAVGGGERSGGYAEDRRAGRDTSVWADVFTPINFKDRMIRNAAQAVEKERLIAENEAYKDPALTPEQRRKAVQEIQAKYQAGMEESALRKRAYGWAGNTMVGRGTLGIASGLASIGNMFVEGASRGLGLGSVRGALGEAVGADNADTEKELARLRKENDLLMRYGEYMRAADDDARGKIFMDKVSQNLTRVARLKKLVGGETPTEQDLADYEGDWQGALTRLGNLGDRMEKEFAGQYRGVYDKLMSDRQRLIYDTLMKGEVAKKLGREVSYDEFAVAPQFAASLATLSGAGVRGLERYIVDRKVREAAQAVQAAQIVEQTVAAEEAADQRSLMTD